ncbi:MAG TPA: redoxin domain-containing protein [Bryobacteraceae bacterium]|nr:redoxin domain-containing protein [Bryobacteraceae bacterium]
MSNKSIFGKSVFGVLSIAAVAVGLAACSSSPKRASAKDRKAAPDFALKDATGATVKLSNLKGKVVLLNFWATWCGPCKVEIPWFIEFQQTYKDRNFTVVGVSMDDDGWASVKPYVTEKKINYRIVIGDDMLAKVYGGVESLPTTFVIDRFGRIASSHVGLISKKQYENEIQRLLEVTADDSNRSVGLFAPGGLLAFVRAPFARAN